MILLKKLLQNGKMHFLQLNLKYKRNHLYFEGQFGKIKNQILQKTKLNVFIFFFCSWYELNTGWISVLFLNGLGFKSTRKLLFSKKRFWRFNVGHSHVFHYFSPKTIIMKIKMRYICAFGTKKSQLQDLTVKLKTFHKVDSYKGIGIKYPNDIIKLKKGKTRQ